MTFLLTGARDRFTRIGVPYLDRWWNGRGLPHAHRHGLVITRHELIARILD